MTVTRASDHGLRKPLRVWPGVVAAVVLFVARFIVKAVIPGFAGFRIGMQWALGAAGVVLLWWLFFSRSPWRERLGVIVLMIVAAGTTWLLRHESMGPAWFFAYVVPVVCLALVAAAVGTRRLPDRSRRATMAVAILLACGSWTLVRMKGISGDHVFDFDWRWARSAEERLLVPAGDPPAAPVTAPVKITRAEWPGFRGPQRNGVSPGVRISTDWSASPPVELWRRPVGPGWSSFAVDGHLFYTQEQRGEDEIVACYDVRTGTPVWTHRDRARFFEANAGVGPRATPTFSDGRVYTHGATGIVNALDADDGGVVWSRNAASDTGAAVPYWGFSSSPLVVGGLVIVAASGRLVAYDRATGEPRWRNAAGGASYSSPHLATIDGVAQVLLVSGAGVVSVSPADGRRLWEHGWRGTPIVQPAVTADGDVLIAASAESGTRRVAVARGGSGWTAQERWTSNGLKPYFNDFVVHDGHAFGFDARILACIDLADGSRKWKGGRYGNGQLVLLPDQDLLLVLSEEGELALVRATPDRFTELARFKAIEGKTWNHPVLVGDVLLVRNGEEMAAFRLPLARSLSQSDNDDSHK